MNPDVRAIAMQRGEPGFDAAVLATSFGKEDPGIRPHALVKARSADDVSQAVFWARDRNWRMACCSGGHAWSQNHIRDSGLLIDLSALDEIAIDPAGRSAVVGPGCVSGDRDTALSPHGLCCLFGNIMKVAEHSISPTGTRWHADNVWLDGPVEPIIPALHETAADPSHIIWLNWNPAPGSRGALAFSIPAQI